MTEFRTQPNPDQPDRCPSIDPDDTLQCGRRIHDDDQCQFGGIAWKKGTPRHVSDRERADAAEAKVVELKAERDLLRAEADSTEAIVQRVEALADVFREKEIDAAGASYQLADSETREASDELARESETWHDALALLRAALAGPEPEATATRDQCCCPADICLGVPGESDACGACLRLDPEEGCLAERQPICPECAQGKHANCDGSAWDDTADAPTDCACAAPDHRGGA